jgi:hypothetical protein
VELQLRLRVLGVRSDRLQHNRPAMIYKYIYFIQKMVYKYNYFSIDHSKIRVTTMMFELKLLIRRTFIGASKPFRAPSTSLMPIAIQYVVLIPNNVLNMTLQNADASRIAI